MPLFELAAAVPIVEVDRILRFHWNLTVRTILRTSQNHTFEAHHVDTGAKYAVRVTPDPTNKYFAQMSNEVHFVNYIAQFPTMKGVCCPVATKDGDFLVRDGILTVMVIAWAEGSSCSFLSYRWMHDEDFVSSWGKWIGDFHTVSKQYGLAYPDKVSAMQRWDEVHEGLLSGYELSSDDAMVINDSDHYGILHGDVLMSNFYYDENTRQLSVFDWAEVQQGFYLMDIAQSAHAVFMFAENGAFDGKNVPGIDPQKFLDWIVKGYEMTTSTVVDRARLNRMIQMRKAFYKRFGERAVLEGNIPKDMEWFVHYVNRWFATSEN